MKSCPTCKATYPTNFTLCPQDGTALVSTSDLAQGAVLRGKYEIISKLGEGGMGAVYKVRHVHFDEVGALKIVSSRLAEDEGFLRRFRSEALVMRRLNHPHAVRVQDFDETDDGRPFMVMEYVEGRSLDSLLTEGGPMDPARAMRIAIQVCAALDAAHELGIIHRDIKPSNIMVSPAADGGDAVKVFDFGIAKIKEGSSLRAGASLTQAGFVVGTPAYMSPEQCQGLRGEGLDGRTDLYSLGIVLYEMLTGRVPFQAESSVELLMAQLQAAPPDPRQIRAELPADLVEIVLRALQKDPANRFASANDLREALEGVLRSTSDAGKTVAVVGRRTPIPATSAPPAPPAAPPAGGTLHATPIPEPAPPEISGPPSAPPRSFGATTPAAVPVEAPPVAQPTGQQAAAPAVRKRSTYHWLYAAGGAILTLWLVVALMIFLKKGDAPTTGSAPGTTAKTDSADSSKGPDAGGGTTPSAQRQPPDKGTSGDQRPLTPVQPPPETGKVLSGDSSPPALTAELVYANYIQARGGEAALAAWRSYAANGTFEFQDRAQNQSVAGTFENYEESPDRFAVTLFVNNQPVSRAAFDGSRGWVQQPGAPVREMTRNEIADGRRNSAFYPVQRPRDLYRSLRLLGKDSVSGREVSVVEAASFDGEVERLFFDVQSGLLLRRDGHEETPAGRVPLQIYYDDYRDACGGRLPWGERQVTAQQTFAFHIASLRCNVSLPEFVFRRPSAVPGGASGGAPGSLTGQYSGVVQNLTTGVSANFAIAWRESGGELAGCMVVQRPLSGSGTLEGEVNGNTINFTVSGSVFEIQFQGTRQGDRISGGYTVAVQGHPPQVGRFALQKQASNLPRGFNPQNCVED